MAFCAEHVKTEFEKALKGIRDLQISGPAPSPLVRAETYYRYHLMLRTRRMSEMSKLLATALGKLKLPEDVTMVVDIDPVNLM